jgi:hypothetical protein
MCQTKLYHLKIENKLHNQKIYNILRTKLYHLKIENILRTKHYNLKTSNMVQRRPELGSTLLSRGSSGALSNSSSSSGFPPDPDMDSPEGRLSIKRNSDIDSPVLY